MDLDEVRAFVAVADSGSFKAAAAASRQPRGTLRRRVEALESRIGVALLERGRSGVSLTNAGTLLSRHGRQMIRDASALLGTLRTIQDGTKKLRVGLPLGMPPEGLQRMFTFMGRVAPDIRVDVRLAEDPVKELLSSVDVLLCFSHQRPPGKLVSRPLVEMREGLRASEAYLARYGTPRTVAELSQHRLLGWLNPQATATRWPLHKGGTFEIEPAVACADFQLLRRLAARGSGIALLPDVNLPDLDPEDGRLVPVLGDVVGRKHHLHLITPQAVSDSEKFELVTENLRRFLALLVPNPMIQEWARV